jgi:hypothetical protein
MQLFLKMGKKCNLSDYDERTTSPLAGKNTLNLFQLKYRIVPLEGQTNKTRCEMLVILEPIQSQA